MIKTKKCLDCDNLIQDRSIRCRACSKKVPFEQRFWNKVNKDGPTMSHMDSCCWIWIGRQLKTKFNYGYFDVFVSTNKSISVYAHRISWELANNQPVPKKLYVLHKCDNPPCVNPAHLFLGTYKDNSDDMIAKGRDNHVKGENHGCAKLTWLQVDKIRDRYASSDITQKQLSKEYNVSEATIRRIIVKKIWKS